VFAEAVAHQRRYYPVLPVPAEQAILHSAIGLDLLVLMPQVRSVR
jgi:hypothetical protein